MERKRLGKAGEDLVAERLAAAGWRLLARNARTRAGEIDLVALDGRCLTFIEVKTRRAGSLAGPETPSLAVGRQKQARLRRLARDWLGSNPLPAGCESIRFDVVGITCDRSGAVLAYEHIEDAFQ